MPKTIMSVSTFHNLSELHELTAHKNIDHDPKNIYVKDVLGNVLKTVKVEFETLTDGSTVINVVLS